MDSSELRVGIIPMTSTDRVEVNSQRILESLESVKKSQPHLVCFPENSLYFNFQPSLDPQRALTLQESVWGDLSLWAQNNNCFLHFGGIPLKEAQGVFNASVLINNKGQVSIVYRKIHLFDVNVQGRKVQESDSFSPGNKGQVVAIAGWNVGMTICYDLRFAELFIQYHQQQADLILVPASFLVPTGRSHWQTLLRARAIETQAYVVAAAQVGSHRSQLNPALPEKQTWGESLVVGPWGEIIAASRSFDQTGEDLPFVVSLKKQEILQVRQQIPLLSHRRLGVETIKSSPRKDTP